MIKPGDRIRLTDYAAKAFNKNMRPGLVDWCKRRGVVQRITYSGKDVVVRWDGLKTLSTLPIKAVVEENPSEANLDGSRFGSYRSLSEMLPRHRMVFKVDDRYYGWTGREQFGVIRLVRGRWAVTCWAHVLFWVYGNGRVDHGTRHWDLYFDRLEEAIKELDGLMDVAERLGRLEETP